MVNQRLINYIREQIKAGYTINTIKTYLIKQGYNAQEVVSSIKTIYVPKKIKAIPKKLIITVVILGILVALLIPTIYILSSSRETTQPFDLKVAAINPNIKQGEELQFNVELKSQNKIKEYDILLKYEIINTNIVQQENIKLKGLNSKMSKIKIPQDWIIKKYNLKTTALYNNQKIFSTFSFNVISKDSTIQKECIENWKCGQWKPFECPDSKQQTRNCNDLNNCGTTTYKPSLTKTCTSTEIPESVDASEPKEFKGLTIWEKLDAIEEIAQSDPAKAANYCDDLEIESHKNDCYYNIAEISQSISRCYQITKERIKDQCVGNIAKLTLNSELCKEIEKTTRKDSCYQGLVNRGDYSVCEEISNQDLKAACNVLRQVPDVLVS